MSLRRGVKDIRALLGRHCPHTGPDKEPGNMSGVNITQMDKAVTKMVTNLRKKKKLIRPHGFFKVVQRILRSCDRATPLL
jgi:hypothetical protein